MRFFRFIRYAIYAAVILVLVTASLANRGNVTLNTMPEGLVQAFPWMTGLSFSIELPLYIVVLGGLVLGFFLGELFEWLREYKYRSEASEKKAEVRKLERQLKKTQAERDKDKDEVLAILDQAS